MTFDILIATRNRQDALALSLPTMLRQSVRPSKLIIVDASDDQELTCRTIEQALAGSDTELVYLSSGRGKTRQLNAGLPHVTAEVVHIPDDDSLWHPGTAEAMLKAYCRSDAVGGVCAAEAADPPPEAGLGHRATYSKARFDRLVTKLQPLRRRIERKVVPDPFVLHGKRVIASREKPRWLAEDNCVLVEWMTGFRMSFRSDVIKRVGFDPLFVNYAGFDDVEASFHVLEQLHLVGARNARVYHHRFPGKRADGFGMGMRQILNRTYIICKYEPKGSPVRRCLKRYLNYKLFGYGVRRRGGYGSQRLAGAKEALRHCGLLIEAEPEQLAERYREARTATLAGRSET